MKKNSKLVTVLKWSGISLGSFFVAAAIAFFVAIGCGVVPMAQDLWVETAMTTFHHHWLAEMIVSPEVIDEHQKMLEELNALQNSIQTDTNLIQIPDKDGEDTLSEEELARIEEEKYAKEGYTKHSDGVYIKEVKGVSSGGAYVGYLMLCPDPARVKLVDTSRQFVCGEQVSSMMANSGAVGAINGGGFVDGPNFNSNGGTPYGILIENGELVSGYEGGYYRLVGMTESNIMIAGSYSGSEALDMELRHAVVAEAILVANGDKKIKGTGGWGVAPRTALGQRATGEVIFLAVDGRQIGYSMGCDLGDLADILIDEGCVNGAMLDGGSSTVMETATYLPSGECTVELVNKPNLGHTIKDQRWINNAWVIMPKPKNVVNSNEEAPHDGLIAK